MFIGRPGRRPLRPLHNHHFFIHSLTVKKLLPLIRQRTTRCTHSRSDKTHKSNPFLKIHSYLQFYDIPKLSSLSFLIVTSLLHEFYQKSTYFYTILQLSYSHHIHTPSTSAISAHPQSRLTAQRLSRPPNQTQTQPLQSSSAALTTHNQPSNDTISHRKHQPGKGMLDGSASAGGELILGRRESALFFKSPLSERQQAASSDF